MKTFLTATAFALLTSVAMTTAHAADQAACEASWNKMDTKKAGYMMSADAKPYMDAMTKAGRKMAAADRLSSTEFMDACRADIFKNVN